MVPVRATGGCLHRDGRHVTGATRLPDGGKSGGALPVSGRRVDSL
ncbi:hypothetical protein EBESD8_36670 [Rhodococcus aetherivorans]|nr:hypothetical protein EBESD8_36670 [Rhodococcus aetherivorans]